MNQAFSSDIPSDNSIRNLIWLYFILLIFEGALRKWLFTSYSDLILIIRDPVAILIILISIYNKVIQFNFYLICATFISIFSIFTAVLFGHGDLLVALYGARIMLVHFPLIFVLGIVLNERDILKISDFLIVMSIPMTILIAFQFFSPQSSWVNLGVGGNTAGAGFSGALGFYRPPGTFSFTNGNTLFFSLVVPVLLHALLTSKSSLSKILLQLAMVAVIIAIPLSISRALYFSVIITMIFVLISFVITKSKFYSIFYLLILILILGYTLSQFEFFKTALEVFSYRFMGANESEGGLQGVLGVRYIGGILRSLKEGFDLPFWGGGIGLGTSLGAKVLSGSSGLLVSEDEWGRIIGELGLILGIMLIFIRVSFSIDLVYKAYTKMSVGVLFPWLLSSFVLLNLSNGQWAQPTSLGFSIFSTGLFIASLKMN